MMIFDREFAVNAGARYGKLLLAGIALAGAALLPSVALAQSVWGGVGSSTATADYNLGTNWSTSPTAPTAAGSSAQFNNTGLATVTVTAGPIAPNSWTFLAASQSYNVTGANVNFSNAATVTNNANAGQAISIANNMTGTTMSQAAASTLTLSGTNAFTNTSVTAGTLANTGSLTSSVVVGAGGTFSNSSTVTGTVNNAGTINANGGAFNGAISNNAGGAFNVSGTVTSNGTFNNATATSSLIVNTGSTYTVTGALTNSGNNAGGGFQVATGATLTANGGFTNNAAATFVNRGTMNGALNNAGIATNRGIFNGPVTNSSLYSQMGVGSVTSGSIANTGTILASDGAFNGAISNNANGIFNVNSLSTVTSSGTFNNAAATSRLTVNTGSYTVTGLITNSGTNAGGGIALSISGTLNGNSGITNNAGATIVNGGRINAVLNNAGIVTNNVTYNGDVATNTGTITNAAGATWTGNVISNAGNTTGITNNSLWTGNVLSNTGTINNNLTWAGAVSNGGTFKNNAAGTLGGLLTNTAGATTNAGQLNSGVLVSGGTVSNSNIVNAGVTVSGAGAYTQTAGATSGGVANTSIVNANGGAINGAIANNAGGTFNVGGSVTSNNTFSNAAANSVLHVLNGGNYTVTGLVTNSGTAAGGGILVDAGGRLTATAGGITNNVGATIVNNGRIDDALNNAGAVTNNLTYNADVNTNTGTITNAATGAWTGNVISNAGNAITNNGVWVGNIQSSTGTVNNNLTWTGTVSNGGIFNNNAAGTVSGLLTNTAGVTTNNGTLSAGATVNGGLLTGQGVVIGATTIAGGTFAPGNGTPGTAMTLTGSLALQSGAVYMVQINPATSSLANVTGNATLGGATVQANFTTGSYIAKQYLILHTTTGVTGTFNPTVANGNLPATFKTSLSYDPNGKDVHLDLELGFVPPSGSLNGNQQNVGNALIGFFNSTGGIPLVFSGLTPAGLTQISGETATGTQQTTFDAMTQFMGVMTDPFIASRGDGMATGSGATSFAEEIDAANAYAAKDAARGRREREAYAAVYRKAPVMAPFVASWSVWAAGFGGSQTTSGNSTLGSNDTTSRLGAVAVGADYRFSASTIAGFALAGGGTSFSVANGGTGRSDLFQAGAFVRHTVGPAYFTGALAYGWQDITTDRTVTIAGADQLRARFNANAFSGRVEEGYRFATPWIGITPYAAGQFITFELPAYAESAVSGANTFALAYGAKSATASRSEIGLRTDKSWAMPGSVLTLRGRFAWAHDYNTDRSIGATFQTLPGASFVVNGAAQSADKALTTASAEVKWRSGVSLAATFEGEFSSNSSSYAGKGVARYQW